MRKYKIGEILSSGRATLYKNPSDQTVLSSRTESQSTTAFRALKGLGTEMNPSPSPSVGRNSKNNEGNFGSQKPLDQMFKVSTVLS